MKKITLRNIAHTRSGDKGRDANIGVIAKNPEAYNILKKHLTSEIVKKYFNEICSGEVIRYELPTLMALNFLLKGALSTGGSSSLRSDAQGKALAEALLFLQLEI